MEDLLYINHANDYATDVGASIWHPLVSIIHFDELGKIRHSLNKLGVYAIFVQNNFPFGLTYGAAGYKIGNGSLTAASPGQIIGKTDNGQREQYHGWAIFFEAEFMQGTDFERRLEGYHFFSYNVNEALRLEDDEKWLMWRLMEMIREELVRGEGEGNHNRIVQDYILLICDYCQLFYQRQFTAMANQQSDLLSRLQKVLSEYYKEGLQYRHGLPNVKYCASELFLSPSYFGDVIRRLTGEGPTHIIQRFLVDRAKNLMVSGKAVSQVSEELGFEYPQHFTRFFKKHTGIQPSKYITSHK